MTKKLIRLNASVPTVNIATKNMHVGKVNGKNLHADYYVIEGVNHMIRGAVMNGLRYSNERFDELSSELMKSNARIPAPLSHPSDENGNFVDANDPITFASHNVGAFDTDWRVNGDKLVSNTYIPVDSIENPKDDNTWLSDRIKNQLPIDRSTGLYLNVDDTVTGFGIDGEPYHADVTQIFELNHSAILNPDIEPGAKNNSDGVGMFCNASGDKSEVDEVALIVNASSPAMKLPLAPADYIFNESNALSRIKEYTNSVDKPSTSYRKFFLEFNQDDVANFDSYTNLFADVIGGVPHAIKSQITNVDNEYAKAYVNMFDCVKNNKQSFVKKVLNKVFSVLQGNELSQSDVHDKIYKKLNLGREDNVCSYWPVDIFSTYFVYRGESDKLYKQHYSLIDDDIIFIDDKVEVKREVEYEPINNNEDRIMREKYLAALAKAGIKTDGLDDDALKAAYEKLDMSKENESKNELDDKESVDDKISKAVANAIAPLVAQLTANSDKELQSAVDAVVAMNKGIDATAAKAMGLTACNAFLAANGQPAIGVNGGQYQQNTQDSAVADLPE